MNITDEMVERAAEAAYMADIFRLRTESDMWLTWETLAKAAPTTAAERYRRMARAALEAALGDVEPLELPDWIDVITGNLRNTTWAVRLIGVNPIQEHYRYNDRTALEGTGSTIDAAIRNAVANATGESA